MIIKNINALGLFGGASLNAVELALINTDGVDVYDYMKTAVVPYPEKLALDIRTILNRRTPDYAGLEKDEQVQQLKNAVSRFYADIIKEFATGETVDVIGIDGLTIGNSPQNQCSYQLEDGHIVADVLQRQVITHFHKADLLSGGQASPLAPIFFSALGQNCEKPALFIDLETVCGLVYVGASGELVAFDAAPALALIEDWTFRHANMQTDYNGRLAITGQVHPQIVEAMLHHKILQKQPPKSLDMMCFADKREHLEGLSLEDGAATVTAFVAEAIFQAALDFLPKIPSHIYVGGEGLKNPSLMRFLKQSFAPREIKTVNDLVPNLRALGACVTAYNAARRLYALPITFPSTTGVSEPITGGEFYEKS
ncbi:MAG: anhydro-N-acetylmuramic acid kinase [Alphaproteobacteria bacterium]|nr:anhydro-N-acetylmuramic acid kinase [Alphaproteobacteria bacterium]